MSADLRPPSMPRAAGAATVPASAEQLRAIETIATWYHDLPRIEDGIAPVFLLDGPAGSGKTSVATAAAERALAGSSGLGGAVYAAFTGKAAHVLRTKGAAPAKTIHSLIYLPRVQVLANLRRLREQRDAATAGAESNLLDAEIRAVERQLSQPGWTLRGELATDAALIVVDEASMLGADLLGDLRSFGVPILALGDKAQLSPVKASSAFADRAPDFALTQIHRQKEGSVVLGAATAIRLSSDLPDLGARSVRYALIEARAAEQVLCWRNATRWRLIHAMRAGRGPLPAVGERIIALHNDPVAGVFNGQQLIVVEEPRPDPRDAGALLVVVRTDDDEEFELRLDPAGFTDHRGEKQALDDARQGSGLIVATHATAITVHKAQGSQWSSVLVVDETGPMIWATKARWAGQGMPEHLALAAGYADARRWLYTAVSRARLHVAVVPPNGVAELARGWAA